jgi:DNA-binding MarR family transcriptional regulator
MPESIPEPLGPEIVQRVAATCLCLHAQRAARALARLFDGALRPLRLTNGQFSLLMALNRPEPPSIGQLAPFLAMDRTSLTAALKPLERRGLVLSRPAEADRRSRIVSITPQGVALLQAALPIWHETHARLDANLGEGAPERLRADLRTLPDRAKAASAPGPAKAASATPEGEEPDAGRLGPHGVPPLGQGVRRVREAGGDQGG